VRPLCSRRRRWRLTEGCRGDGGDGKHGGGLEELEVSHLGASDELSGSRSTGVAEVALDAGDERDITMLKAASRWSTGHGK
jgi:hypothetical protein